MVATQNITDKSQVYFAKCKKSAQQGYRNREQITGWRMKLAPKNNFAG